MISPTTPKKLTGKKRNLFEDSGPTENIQSHQLQREFEERELELEREYELKKKGSDKRTPLRAKRTPFLDKRTPPFLTGTSF